MKLIKLISLVGVLGIISAFVLPGKSFYGSKESPIEILNTWELPNVLREVSGIDWIGDNKIAAVEDEDGIIFIYDLKTKEITTEIEFADKGDYEGIAINGANAYVMRSDGLLFEVLNYKSDKRTTKTYQSALSHKNNVETLALDSKRNRLLIAPKDEDPNDENIKGVYAFDLKGQTMLADLVFRIDMKDKALKDYQEKKSSKTFRPSDLAINPLDGKIYMLEGVNPKLLILDATGTITKVIKLDKKHFPQPEGITFTPDGKLYISNEGAGGKATLLEVKIL